MTDQTLCPLCEEGYLHEHSGKVKVEYHGNTALLDSRYSLCDFCGAEQAAADQVRHNKRTMIAFKKTVDGLLSGSQVRAIRERFGITQSQAALIFGGGPVAFSKYESDDVMQSEAMDKLLRLADKIPEAFKCLAYEAKVTLEPERPWVDVNATAVSPKKHRHLRLVNTSKPLINNPSERYA